jgi:hypothetical protein
VGGSRDDKRIKRAHEDLRRGLARRDGELACDGLLALPAPERGPGQLAAVAALCAPAIEQMQARGEWSRLVPWAKRLEVEPRLLTVLEPESSCAVRWALLWGCAQSGEWGRAARLWADLAPEATARQPAIAQAVGAWIGSRGAPRPIPDAIAAFAPEAPDRLVTAAPVGAGRIGSDARGRAADPRLGIEPIGPRTAREREPADPQSPQDAENATVRARAVLGSAGLAGWVARVFERVDADTARALGEAASSIALRDVLARMEERGSDRSASLDVVAACARRGVVPTAHLLTSIRIVVRWLREGVGAAPHPDAVCSIARGCMRDEAIAAIVRDALLGIAQQGTGKSVAADTLLAALGAVAEIAPSASLWATGAVFAMQRAERSDGHRPRPSRRRAPSTAWLELQGEQIAAQADALVAWMRTADPRARFSVLAFAADRLPANAAGPLLVAVSTIDDERLRRDVARSVEDLLGRFSMRYCPSCGFDHEPELLSYRDLSPVARGLWDTIEGAVCDLSPALLNLALERATSAAARGTLIQRFAHRADAGGAWLEAIALARRFRLRKLPAELLERMLARFADEPGELAAAYQIAWNEVGRMDVLVPIAHALVHAVSRSAVPPRARVAAVVARAQRLLDAERAKERRRARRRGGNKQLVLATAGGSDGAA